MLLLIISIVACVMAGIGRAVVGAGKLDRAVVYPFISFFASAWAFGVTWWMLPFAIVPMMMIWLGWTKWEDPVWMSIRYGLFPGILAFTYGVMTGDPSAIIWAAACASYGSVDWIVRVKLEPYGFEVLGQQIDSARYAEFLTGAIIVGGVAFL